MRTFRSVDATVTLSAAALEHWMIGVVAALSCGPVACGDGSNSIENNPGFVRPACSPTGAQEWLRGMTLPAGTDYIELKEDNTQPWELGVACATAPDMMACMNAVESAPVSGIPIGPVCTPDVCPRAYLVETRGGDVIVASTLDQARQALLPIDGASKAILLVYLSGFDISCTESGAAPTKDGWLVMGLTYEGCGGKTRHVLEVKADGTVRSVSSQVLEAPSSNCVVGRRPPGLRAGRAHRSPNALGAYFSEMATLEAASVHAFVRIEAELALYGAPPGLVQAAGCAARDEERHARDTAKLARRFGAKPLRPRVGRAPLRASLADFAVDNEEEGCVRETFGALVGMHQAIAAKDRDVARALRAIAADECCHAALAWQIARWVAPRLTRRQRARVRGAREQAVASLLVEIDREPSVLLVSNAGLPGRAAARVLHGEARLGLWKV